MSTEASAPGTGAFREGDPVGADERDDRSGLVRTLTAILLNLGVLTALLVYFGWVRSDRMAAELGIDESILRMSVEDYLLRSVRSVFVPVLCIGLAALAWVGFDRWWTVRKALNANDPLVRWFARWMCAAPRSGSSSSASASDSSARPPPSSPARSSAQRACCC